MNIVRYLPSTQFLVIVGSLLLSGGLVVAAQRVTHTPLKTATLSYEPTTTPKEDDWQSTLTSIEGASIANTSQKDTEATTQTLLEAATSNNVTDTVARTLLVNLSAAKSQGLGSDIPTQESLVAQAAAQIGQNRGTPTYTTADIPLSNSTLKAQKEYGNAVMAAIQHRPQASNADVLLTIGAATDNGDPSKLSPLIISRKEYALLTKELAAIPTPPSLVPLHLQIINDLARMDGTFVDMQLMFEDPLRGLSGFELYDALNSEAYRVFTNIAQQLSRNGILFTKDEPGAAWGEILSLQNQ